MQCLPYASQGEAGGGLERVEASLGVRQEREGFGDERQMLGLPAMHLACAGGLLPLTSGVTLLNFPACKMG